MVQSYSDEQLANDINAQAHLIQQAYASGEKVEIDNALNRITNLRRMISTGIYDLIKKD